MTRQNCVRSQQHPSTSLVVRAAVELDEIRQHELSIQKSLSRPQLKGSHGASSLTNQQNHQMSENSLRRSRERSTSSISDVGFPFPQACRMLVRMLPGNSHCVDCGYPNPEWASVTYGTLLCVQCCGRHRSYGVNVSYTRSIDMDTWTSAQILAMLEGCNHQLLNFFQRNGITARYGEDTEGVRYRTKAAKFYKCNLAKHVQAVAKKGSYQGREASRSPAPSTEEDIDNNQQFCEVSSSSSSSVLSHSSQISSISKMTSNFNDNRNSSSSSLCNSSHILVKA